MSEIPAPSDGPPSPPNLPGRTRAEYLVRRSELDDQVETLERALRGHTWRLGGLWAAASVFGVLAVVSGVQGYVVACSFLALLSLKPLGRRMITDNDIRKLRKQIARLDRAEEEEVEEA
jgi:hypothetical protein